MNADHGLVIGKFYPPHLGHHLLIRTAAATCRRVSVVVMASMVESIPLAARIAWLQAEHRDDANVAIAGVMDEHAVDYRSEAAWSAHVGLMREALAAISAPPVTAVFTSEAYGPELARRFRAVHVAVDRDRRLVPVSGSDLRRDLVGNWEFLSSPVRGGLALRVVILGAESTGTTTLAQDLALHWQARGGSHRLTQWVPEYGRDYSVDKFARARAAAQLAGLQPPELAELVWKSPEFEHIAATQLAREDAAAAGGGPVLICDTDAFAATVWHERYVGSANPAVARIAESRAHPLYLLTHSEDVPFAQDGLREGEHIREWMTGRFIERLQETGRNTVILRGGRSQRLRDAVAAIEMALQRAAAFAPALPTRSA